ncbi:M-phase inducer phosphatase 3 [Oxyura jamaicensis]|uniref:M-phase inducer phosphatase 3 n=1 Tax=Oxyura jamaicensis TaxID=8884 RepID=UPI0015A54CE5|nr:M-phase inducer phosphatase 3 [Oxyura jamaicensis]
MCLTPLQVAALLSGQFQSLIDKFYVLDCHYPCEYKGIYQDEGAGNSEPQIYCPMQHQDFKAVAEMPHHKQVIDFVVKETGPDHSPHETVSTKAVAGVEAS